MRWTQSVRWFVVGCAVGALAQVLHLAPLGFDAAAALRVGSESRALAVIVSDLGRVPVTEGEGHDGQYYYLIARDPFGLRDYPDLTDDGGYRFRRPLSGWLAGGMGLLPPSMVVWSLILWEILGFGLTAAAVAALMRHLGARRWAMVGALGSLGLWLSVQLVTPDALALGLALWGVVASLRARWVWAMVAFALAGLAKDTYLLFAVSTAGWLWVDGRRREAALTLGAPSAVLLAWATWLTAVVGNGFSSKGNFGLPAAGLVDALGGWNGDADAMLGLVALAGVGVGAIGLLRTDSTLLRWLLAPWLVLAVVASDVIWADGNNAARVFAPLWVLGWLALASRQRAREAQRTSLRNLPV